VKARLLLVVVLLACVAVLYTLARAGQTASFQLTVTAAGGAVNVVTTVPAASVQIAQLSGQPAAFVVTNGSDTVTVPRGGSFTWQLTANSCLPGTTVGTVALATGEPSPAVFQVIEQGTDCPRPPQRTMVTPKTCSALTVANSVSNDGTVGCIGGIVQGARVAGCATGAGANTTCDVTVTWPTAFADTSYTVACSGYGVASGTPEIQAVDPDASKSGASIKVRTVNDAGTGASQFTQVGCLAVHD
jgi:hypothetical protein